MKNYPASLEHAPRSLCERSENQNNCNAWNAWVLASTCLTYVHIIDLIWFASNDFHFTVFSTVFFFFFFFYLSRFGCGRMSAAFWKKHEKHHSSAIVLRSSGKGRWRNCAISFHGKDIGWRISFEFHIELSSFERKRVFWINILTRESPLMFLEQFHRSKSKNKSEWSPKWDVQSQGVIEATRFTENHRGRLAVESVPGICLIV